MEFTGPSNLIVWDRTDAAPPGEDVLCWRSYAHGPSLSSLPAYLESHGESIRAKYLAFVRELA